MHEVLSQAVRRIPSEVDIFSARFIDEEKGLKVPE